MTSHWKVLNKCNNRHGFKELLAAVNSAIVSTFQGAFVGCALAPSSNFVRVCVGPTGPKCYLMRSQNLDGFDERVFWPFSAKPLSALSSNERSKAKAIQTILASFAFGDSPKGQPLSCLYAPLD